MAYKQEQVRSDHYVEIMFIVFGRDISHNLHMVITHSLVLVVILRKS